MTKVYVIQCNKCGDKIYSRARHDFNSCSCGAVSIDGGFSGYTKVSGNFEDITSLGQVEIPYTKDEIIDDWNKNINKLGKLLT